MNHECSSSHSGSYPVCQLCRSKVLGGGILFVGVICKECLQGLLLKQIIWEKMGGSSKFGVISPVFLPRWLQVWKTDIMKEWGCWKREKTHTDDSRARQKNIPRCPLLYSLYQYLILYAAGRSLAHLFAFSLIFFLSSQGCSPPPGYAPLHYIFCMAMFSLNRKKSSARKARPVGMIVKVLLQLDDLLRCRPLSC